MSSAMRETNQELLSLMKQALSHASEVITGGENLSPFVMSVEHDGRRRLRRRPTEETEEYAEEVRRAAAVVEEDRGATRMAVVVVDSPLSVPDDDGRRQDALVAEGHHIALEGPAFQLAQPYLPGKPAGFLRRARPPQLCGTLRFIGTGPNLLLDPQDPMVHRLEVAAA